MRSKGIFTETSRNEKLAALILHLILLVCAFVPFTCWRESSETSIRETCYVGYESPFYWLLVGFAFAFSLVAFLRFRQNRKTTVDVLTLLLIFFFLIFFLGEIGFMSGMPYAPDLQLGFCFSLCSGLLSVIYARWFMAKKNRKRHARILESQVKKSVYTTIALSLLCCLLFIRANAGQLELMIPAAVAIFSIYLFYRKYTVGLVLLKIFLAVSTVVSIPYVIQLDDPLLATSFFLNVLAFWFIGTDAVEAYFNALSRPSN